MKIASFSKIDKHIGCQLRKIRNKRKMTLSEVSSKIGISYQQIQKYEQAETRISVSTLYKLAKLYAVDIERFFVGLADPKNNKNLDRNLSKSSNINLLIVEDNPGDEAIIRNTLTCFNNLNILCVHDGIQALNVLKYKTLCDDFPSANIIFLDIFIPKRDGLSILKEIKRDKEIQDIPVIILTSNINQELMNEAYKLGASGYISKSFDYNIFKESITDCIKYWTKAVNLPNRCISG